MSFTEAIINLDMELDVVTAYLYESHWAQKFMSLLQVHIATARPLLETEILTTPIEKIQLFCRLP